MQPTPMIPDRAATGQRSSTNGHEAATESVAASPDRMVLSYLLALEANLGARAASNETPAEQD